MNRKHKVGLLGTTVALFMLLMSTVSLGATVPLTHGTAASYNLEPHTTSFEIVPLEPPSLISYWKLNERGGFMALDSFGPNDGNIRGGYYVAGVSETGLDLYPEGLVDCGGDRSLAIQELLTIEAWIFLRSAGVYRRTIVQNGWTAADKMYHFGLENDFLYFDRYDGADARRYTRSDMRVTPGRWYHVAVVMDNITGSINFYLNGAKQPMSFNDPYRGSENSRFMIGYGQDPLIEDPNEDDATYLGGMIDEVAVYNGLLSDADIWKHYQNGLAGLGYFEDGETPPLANDDAYTTEEDVDLIVAASGVLANDVDVDGDSLEAILDTKPTEGTLTLNADGSFNYQPNPDFNGDDTFKYRAFDGEFESSLATVTISVTPVNDAPVGVDDSYTLDEDTSLDLAAPALLANDFDIDGDAITLSVLSYPSHGSGSIGTDGSFSYTPLQNWFGTDSMTYRVSDETDSSGIVTVTITVNPVNDAPVAVDDAYSTDNDVPFTIPAPGVLANDYDIEGDSLTAKLVGLPLNGIILLEPDGSLSYIPDANWYGVDTFTYQAFDGTDYGNIATVTITVNYVNSPPTAVPDVFTTEADVPLVVAAPGVLANDEDIDEDPLEAMLVDAPMFGTLLFNPDGSFAYTPAAAWCGVDTFSYMAFDGIEFSDIALVTITVLDASPPVTTIHFTGDEGEFGWYHSDVEVALSAIDDCSGVASTMYSLDGSTWMLYADPFVLDESGEFTVHYYSTDFAGNVEDTKTAIIKISSQKYSYVRGVGRIVEVDGSKGYFAFSGKYRAHRGLRGYAMYIFREPGHVYVVKSREWFGMAIDGDHAILEGKATIKVYNCETKDRVYLEGFYLRIEVWDNGKGRTDVFQIQIFDESGELFHEAGIDPQGQLQCGNIRIYVRTWTCECMDRFKRCYNRWGS